MVRSSSFAQIELNRSKELRDKNTISASEFDQKAAPFKVRCAAVTSSAEARTKDSARSILSFRSRRRLE